MKNDHELVSHAIPIIKQNNVGEADQLQYKKIPHAYKVLSYIQIFHFTFMRN